MIVAVFGENRDSGEDDALDSVRTREPVPPAAHVSELGESGSLSPPVEKGWVGRRPDGSLSILFRQHEQSILLGEWQRAEQYPMRTIRRGSHDKQDCGDRPQVSGASHAQVRDQYSGGVDAHCVDSVGEDNAM